MDDHSEFNPTRVGLNSSHYRKPGDQQSIESVSLLVLLRSTPLVHAGVGTTKWYYLIVLEINTGVGL